MSDIKNNRQKNETGKVKNGKKIPKPVIALFAVIASGALFVLIYFSFYKDEEKKISYKCLYGDAFVNGVRFDEILLAPGDKIITKPESSSEIEAENMFFINIYPDSEIEIENSHYSKRDRNHVFNFRLMSGTIFAKFEKSSDLKYRFITKNAKIESAGTEFLIEISKESTMLVVTDGTLTVTSLKTGETKIARADKIYTIRENIEVSDVDQIADADEQPGRENIINRINDQKSGNKIQVPQGK